MSLSITTHSKEKQPFPMDMTDYSLSIFILKLLIIINPLFTITLSNQYIS